MPKTQAELTQEARELLNAAVIEWGMNDPSPGELDLLITVSDTCGLNCVVNSLKRHISHQEWLADLDRDLFPERYQP